MLTNLPNKQELEERWDKNITSQKMSKLCSHASVFMNEVTELIKVTPQEHILLFGYDRPPLCSWYKGNIVLIGTLI